MQAGAFNKRHANRHSIEMPALLDTCWDEGVLIQLKNLSTEGAYFAAQAPVERDTSVSVSCIVRVPPLIPGLWLPRLQGKVVRKDCGGFAILLRNNHSFLCFDFEYLYSFFLKISCPVSAFQEYLEEVDWVQFWQCLKSE